MREMYLANNLYPHMEYKRGANSQLQIGRSWWFDDHQHMAKTLLGEQDSTPSEVIHKKPLLFSKILESNNKEELFTVEVDFDFYRRKDGSLKAVVEGVFAVYLFPDLFMFHRAGPSILELNKKLLPRQEVLTEVGGLWYL